MMGQLILGRIGIGGVKGFSLLQARSDGLGDHVAGYSNIGLRCYWLPLRGLMGLLTILGL